MSVVKWSEDLRIGIDRVDTQHKRLIAMINDLHLAVKHDKGPELVLLIIDQLIDYASTHFREEEELMKQHDFPHVADHRKEHDDFIGNIDELKAGYQADHKALTLHLRNFMLSWFFNHIKTEDMAYKHYLAKRGVLSK